MDYRVPIATRGGRSTPVTTPKVGTLPKQILRFANLNCHSTNGLRGGSIDGFLFLEPTPLFARLTCAGRSGYAEQLSCILPERVGIDNISPVGRTSQKRAH
jgi:hypothetical protein